MDDPRGNDPIPVAIVRQASVNNAPGIAVSIVPSAVAFSPTFAWITAPGTSADVLHLAFSPIVVDLIISG